VLPQRYRATGGESSRGGRAHDVFTQAVLTCAFLEGGHTYRSLAADNGIKRSTCYAYVQEGIRGLVRRALPVTELVRLAARPGWDYLIVDGVNTPTDRVAAEFTAKQHWFSGKHRNGAAVQTVAAPTGICCGCPLRHEAARIGAIARGEPHPLFAQLALQHRDLMAQGRISKSLSRSPIGSRRSMAKMLDTVR
jgi:hypothetical protein